MRIARSRAEGQPTEEKGPTFTGVVWSDPILPPGDGLMMNSICFTPGAHTFWHSHENGQILQVTAGEGYVCTDGEAPQVIRAGDTVWVPAGERHWHGAKPSTYMVHTATSFGQTRWEVELTADEYPTG